MNPDNTPAAYALRRAMTDPNCNHDAWRQIVHIVRQQTGKAYTECTISEVKAALEQHEIDQQFSRAALHAVVEQSQATCGCNVRVPRGPDGTLRGAEATIEHTCRALSS